MSTVIQPLAQRDYCRRGTKPLVENVFSMTGSASRSGRNIFPHITSLYGTRSYVYAIFFYQYQIPVFVPNGNFVFFANFHFCSILRNRHLAQIKIAPFGHFQCQMAVSIRDFLRDKLKCPLFFR